MAKLRATATDRLSNVIDVVELGRRTGLLSVERDGPWLEEGAVYFVAGRPIYAALGQLRGREALHALATWSQCRFAFDADAERPQANVPDPNAGASRPGSAGSYPGGSGAHTPAVSYPSTNGNGNGGYARSGVWNTGPAPAQSQPQPYNGNGNGNGGYGQSGAYGQSGSYGQSGLYGQQGGSAPVPRVDAAPSPRLMQRPRRAPDVRDLMSVVTRYNLSRTHRTLLLLADGEHTILDLSRLSSKPVDEVLQLLGELEQYGLVYYYG